MKKRLMPIGSAAIVFGCVLVAWRLVILAFSVPSYLLPTPLEVVKAAWLRLPNLWASLMISAEAATGGLLASIVVGVLIALIFARSQWARRMFFPYTILLQTVPILAIAPMIIVVLGAIGLVGLLPKAIISAYLCFFPVTIGMVKGLTSPDPLQLDLMRTYCATRTQTFVKLRAPASAPFFFASMKIGVAAALVGAVVAEVTRSEDGGLGARLLAGSYYGQTVQIWAALFAAAALSAALVGLIGLADRIVSRRMGFAQ